MTISSVPTVDTPALAWRLPLAGCLLGMMAAAVFHLRLGHTDAMIFWDAGRALLAGENPYTWIAGRWRDPLYYPLPAVLIVAPLALLPPVAFHLVWAGLGGLALGAAASRYGRGLPCALLSAGFFTAAAEGQWSPLLTAGAVLPWLGLAFAAKPSLGLALFAGWPDRRAVIGGVLLLILSLVVLPSWPVGWWESLGRANHLAPVMRPGGFLLLLAWLRWRTPEGRLLGALAVIPHTAALYETLPLFLIPRTRWEGYGLALLSVVALAVDAVRSPVEVLPAVSAEHGWPVLLLLVYLPALALVLRRPVAGSLR